MLGCSCFSGLARRAPTMLLQKSKKKIKNVSQTSVRGIRCETNYVPDPLPPYERICVHRYPSPCFELYTTAKAPCFDRDNVEIHLADRSHRKMLHKFLTKYYFNREPSFTGLWMACDSPYVRTLTDKYAYCGDRFMAFEKHPRTHECRLVGLLVAHKIDTSYMFEMEQWAMNTNHLCEQHHMSFMSFCFNSANLFERFHTDYIYNIAVLVTTEEMRGQGVATMLVRRALEFAKEFHYPVVQLLATSRYAQKPCLRNRMIPVWCKHYEDITDQNGSRIFYARDPHHTVILYAKCNPC